MQGGGNTLLYLGASDALLVDAKSFGLGRTLAREARGFGVPVTRFVNTHHHGDHSGGNDAFRNAARLAHSNAAPRIVEAAAVNLERADASLAALRARPAELGRPEDLRQDLEAMARELGTLMPSDFAPTETFDDVCEVDVDGHPVLIRWVSPGHTDGDAFLYLPDDNVLHCGDLFFHGRHPYIDTTADATPDGWVRCVESMLSLCDADTVVVPGHGEVTDRVGLEGQRDYFLQLRSLVEQAVAEGRPRDEAVTMGTGPLRALTGAEQRLQTNLGVVYDEMTR